jgi:hypothetical protein
MTFEFIQDRIGEKLQKVNSEITMLESIECDYNTQQAAKLDARMRILTDNSNFLEMLAYFIINQDAEIAALKEQNNRANMRIAALLTISERTTLRANAAQAVTSLYRSKFDYYRRETDEWLKKELSEDFSLLVETQSFTIKEAA